MALRLVESETRARARPPTLRTPSEVVASRDSSLRSKNGFAQHVSHLFTPPSLPGWAWA